MNSTQPLAPAGVKSGAGPVVAFRSAGVQKCQPAAQVVAAFETAVANATGAPHAAMRGNVATSVNPRRGPAAQPSAGRQRPASHASFAPHA